MSEFNAFYQKDVARVEKRKLDLQEFSEGLKRASATLSGNNTINNQNNSNDSRGGMMYMLSSNYMSGMNRICIYKLGTTTATHTMKGARMCPATMRF